MGNDFPLLLHTQVALATCFLFANAGLLSCYYCLVHLRLIQPKPRIATIPLQTLEKWLTMALYWGVASFTFLLISSFYSFSSNTILSPLGRTKIVLSIGAWLLLSVLAIGRRYWGWRGEYTAFSLVVGTVVLCLIYVLA